MSENVELVKAAFEVFERDGPEGLLPVLDPEIEIYTDDELPEHGTYRGRQGFLGWISAWLEAWEDFRMEPADFIEVGESVVVVPAQQAATGTGSGVEVDMRLAYLFQVRAGTVTRLHLYPTLEGALEVAERLTAEN